MIFCLGREKAAEAQKNNRQTRIASAETPFISWSFLFFRCFYRLCRPPAPAPEEFRRGILDQ
jgi:hypothetical protein